MSLAQKLARAISDPRWAARGLYHRVPLPRSLIITPHYLGGFFSNFNLVMNHLVCSLDLDRIRAIEVDWRVDASMLGRPDRECHFCFGLPEDGNLWERLFFPLPFVPRWYYQKIRTNRYRDYALTGEEAYHLYRGDPAWRQTYHRAYQRFIRPRPPIEARAAEIDSKVPRQKYRVGAHVRHEGHSYELPGGESPALGQYFRAIESLCDESGDDYVVFLATDVEAVVEAFSERFGARLVVQAGVTRQPTHDDPELHVDHPHPDIKLAEDVLIDALLLARCDALVHVTSNVATAVGYMNPGIRMVYCE